MHTGSLVRQLLKLFLSLVKASQWVPVLPRGQTSVLSAWQGEGRSPRNHCRLLMVDICSQTQTGTRSLMFPTMHWGVLLDDCFYQGHRWPLAVATL